MKKWIKCLCLVIPMMVVLSAFVFMPSKSRSDGEVVSSLTVRSGYNPGVTADPADPGTNTGTGAASAAINKKGGAIYLEENTNYTMSGGTISNHSNTYGGAIFINPGATFTMKGGTIKNCSADYGGAIYVRAGATCNIEGGAITGCSANKNGAAIYVESGATLNLSSAAEVDSKDVYNEGGSVSTDLIQVGNTSSTTYLHYLEFGSYPQTYVGDAMNAELESWYNSTNPTRVKTYQTGGCNTSEKTFLGKGRGDVASAADPGYGPCGPTTKITYEAYEYNGQLYARGKSYPWSGYSTTYQHNYKDGTAVKSKGTICWFKVEPIKWVVLNYDAWKAGENLQVMSLLAIVANSCFDGTEWSTSDLRQWMNDLFYNSAFSAEEQEMIVSTTLKSKTYDNTEEVTEDNVYILSEDELTSILTTNDSLMTSPTDFVLSGYSQDWYSDPYSDNYSTAYRKGVCEYLTRDKGYHGESTYCMCSGVFGMDDPSFEHPLRPALCLNI